MLTGTVAFGMWVIGHECGHNAFCDPPWVGHIVGYVFHSILLVPYFTWRRSHAVHHAHTGHVHKGETHVPLVFGTVFGTLLHHVHRVIGNTAIGVIQLFMHLVIGWPAYLLIGTTGSSVRNHGMSNHFVAWGGAQLFPWRAWKLYLLSTGGVGTMLGLLYWWVQVRALAEVLGLYGGPLMVVNAWLTAVTWMQHTDVNVPHLDESLWTWMLGALQTVDRPYHWILDILHHRIGTTHMMHHLVSTIPHYHAQEATVALRTAFPHLFQVDPTPITEALWRLASQCVVSYDHGDGNHWFLPPPSPPPCARADVWRIAGKSYDLTTFAARHPGGANRIHDTKGPGAVVPQRVESAAAADTGTDL